MGHSSIGRLYEVCVLYWWAVWGIALLVGCMGYGSVGGFYEV